MNVASPNTASPNTASTQPSTAPVSLSHRQDNADAIVVMGDHNLTIEDVASVARHGKQVCLTHQNHVLQQVQASCDYIAQAVASGEPIYGVTSGFGGMANVTISSENAAELQNNLIWYHKVGVGQRLSLRVCL